MMSVGDQAGPESVGGELLPDVVVVTRQHGVRAVAEVRAGAGAGSDGGVEAVRAGGGVAERHDDAGAGELFDEGERARCFRRQRHHADHAVGGFLLEAAKFIPGRRPDVLLRMRPTRSVLGGDVRSFEMDADDGLRELDVLRAGFANRAEPVHESVERASDQGGAKLGDPVPPARGHDVANLFLGELFRIEADAVTAVDLHVAKCRRDPFGFTVGRLIVGRLHPFDLAVRAHEIEPLSRPIMPRPHTHGRNSDPGLGQSMMCRLSGSQRRHVYDDNVNIRGRPRWCKGAPITSGRLILGCAFCQAR